NRLMSFDALEEMARERHLRSKVFGHPAEKAYQALNATRRWHRLKRLRDMLLPESVGAPLDDAIGAIREHHEQALTFLNVVRSRGYQMVLVSTNDPAYVNQAVELLLEFQESKEL